MVLSTFTNYLGCDDLYPHETMEAMLMYLIGTAVALFAGAAIFYLSWNYFVKEAIPGVPGLNYWRSMAGVLFIGVLRSTWCCNLM